MIKYLFAVTIFFCCLFVCNAETAEKNEQEGTAANVYLGFGLVAMGAFLATLGSLVLYSDKLIRLIPGVSQTFSLSESKTFLTCSLSFSVGVLLVTIFLDLVPEGIEAFEQSGLIRQNISKLIAGVYFVGCLILVTTIKYLFHRKELKQEQIKEISLNQDKEKGFTAHSNASGETVNEINKDSEKFKGVGYKVAIAIAIHNFPEGVVTFVTAYKSMTTGILFGLALGLHKFPEGLMISVPIYYGTGSKFKACLITFLASFITQILGALVAYLLFQFYYNEIFNGLLFLLASSILLHTVFSEMLPIAKAYDPKDVYSTIWICIGLMSFILLTSIVGE